jgi:hypothetical protein
MIDQLDTESLKTLAMKHISTSDISEVYQVKANDEVEESEK